MKKWFCLATSPAAFARHVLGLPLDKTQEALLNGSTRRVILNCTRQWGKSTIGAAMALWRALFFRKSLIVVGSPCGRQSGVLVFKIREFAKSLGLKVTRDRDVRNSVCFENGSRVLGLPKNPDNVRGYGTVSLLIVDEASRVKDDMFVALTPMTAVENGDFWMLSTPNGRKGMFYHAWTAGGDEWRRVAVAATECPWINMDHLETSRRLMGPKTFAQEYLCQFGDLKGAMYPGELLERAVKGDVKPMEWWRPACYTPMRTVDIGRGMRTRYVVAVDLGMVGSPSVIVVIELGERELGFDAAAVAMKIRKVYQVRWMETVPLGTAYCDVVKRVKELVTSEALAGRCDVVVDSTGVGGSVIQDFRKAGLGCPVVKMVITGGENAGGERMDRTVPRKDLLHAVRGALDQEELEVAGELKELGAWTAEMSGIHCQGTAQGSDDLAMALGMGVWWGRMGLGWRQA